MKNLRNLPAVDKLLTDVKMKALIDKFGKELVIYSIRNTIDVFRKEILNGSETPEISEIIAKINDDVHDIYHGSLRPVINATGVIIYTNLGRVPFSKSMFDEVAEILTGYSNLEYDLDNAKRSNRNVHASKLLKYLTGAEDIAVVNNNAAAVILILNSIAKNKEVLVSRGELIEIGGSFRIPDIMATSGCKMVEVGSTNKTHLSDYENAINENTALLFKAHQSNYSIKGFVQEVSLEELVVLGKKFNIPVIYDMGSGLLTKIDNTALENEPDTKQALSTGVDLVTFSGDKLLGGPQAGIIAGKKAWVQKLKKDPMMRALRVCKITLAFLENACRYYLNNEILFKKNLIFKTLNRGEEELKSAALLLQKELLKFKINTKILKSEGQYGGGSMSDKVINSYAVIITKEHQSRKEKTAFAENLFRGLLKIDKPVLGILKQGDVHFDILNLFEKDIIYTAGAINKVYHSI